MNEYGLCKLLVVLNCNCVSILYQLQMFIIQRRIMNTFIRHMSGQTEQTVYTEVKYTQRN